MRIARPVLLPPGRFRGADQQFYTCIELIATNLLTWSTYTIPHLHASLEYQTHTVGIQPTCNASASAIFPRLDPLFRKSFATNRRLLNSIQASLFSITRCWYLFLTASNDVHIHYIYTITLSNNRCQSKSATMLQT